MIAKLCSRSQSHLRLMYPSRDGELVAFSPLLTWSVLKSFRLYTMHRYPAYCPHLLHIVSGHSTLEPLSNPIPFLPIASHPLFSRFPLLTRVFWLRRWIYHQLPSTIGEVEADSQARSNSCFTLFSIDPDPGSTPIDAWRMIQATVGGNRRKSS